MQCLLCIFGVAVLTVGVFGDRGKEISDAVQKCCEQGTNYGRSHSVEDCSSSPPPSVPSRYSSFCIFAMDECCKEYFRKKSECQEGIELASAGQCAGKNESVALCCNQCLKGIASGSRGSECDLAPKGSSAEDLLSGDAFKECCEKSASEPRSEPKRPESPSLSQSGLVGSVAASICEEYAPNELCAHHCIPIPGSYRCECNPGFQVMADGRNCMELTNDRCKPRNPCQHKCTDNGIEVKCSCTRGYQLMSDGKSCEDINECLQDIPVCLPNAQCINIEGSYRCIPNKKKTEPKIEMGHCPPGYFKNVKNNACDDIDECNIVNPPCPSYLCENTIGGFKCDGVPGDPALALNKHDTEDRCPPGFKTGANEQCEDVDECAINTDDCNRLSQFCINTKGSYHCQNKASKHCPPGFKINPRNSRCEDIDECEETQDICRPNQVCVNVPGEYHCVLSRESTRKQMTCPMGTRKNHRTEACEDIDECAEGTHLCDQYQTCQNLNGSHECICKQGYELDPITGACIDINECAIEQDTCLSRSQRCENSVGSYLCIRITPCGTGYILHHTTGACEDINECVLGTHNCDKAGPGYTCENHPGSFRCVKKRVSTSTTAKPELEYEYYYSEEETETNQTNSKDNQPRATEEPITTTTFKPIPEQPQPPENYSPPTIDSRINVATPQPERKPEEYVPLLPEAPVEQDIPNEPQEQKPVERKPEEYEPRLPETPVEPTPKPESSKSSPEEAKPEVNESAPSSTEATAIHVVNVSVGKETAVIQGERREDGSVLVDTKDIPKNEWTKIEAKPTLDCPRGFDVNDNGACVDIDECATGSHSCSGLTETCINTIGGYRCECAIGFRRDLTTGVCDIITTSSTSTTTPPTPSSSESSYFWGYPEYRPKVRPFRPHKRCDFGFHPNSQTGKCEDINECTNGQANCASVEICVNTVGGYVCECPPNWQLDSNRQRCVPVKNIGQWHGGAANVPVYPPIDPVINAKDVDQVIKGHTYVEPEVNQIDDTRDIGSVINCPRGYRLGYDNNCEDIDECVTGEAKCGFMVCTNLRGGYVCSCPPGHKLVDENRCEDVDECTLGGNNSVCSQNAECVNTIGSYLCRCHQGFRPAPNNEKVCIDVDECVESTPGSLCHHRCNNVWGGYRCSCHKGFRLNADNSTCSDVDECVEYKSKVPCVGQCVNEQGSFRCTCPPGYRLSEDKRSCIDIDECETGTAPCAKSETCLNTRGGYRCQRVTCPPGYRIENKHRCIRIEKNCDIGDTACEYEPTTYTYNFITFVSKLYIPDWKVELFTMKGPSNVPNAKMNFNLKLIDVDAPPTVKNRANVHAFKLTQKAHAATIFLLESLEGPQKIELEMSMELYHDGKYRGRAVAKIFIYVTEYEF